jgi:hypothetical protein
MSADLASVNLDAFDFAVLEAEDAKLMKGIDDWPPFVQVGLGIVKRTLAKVGLTVNFDDIKHPGEYLDLLIEKMKKSPSLSPYKWLALTALYWLHDRIHADHDIFAKAMRAA